MWMQHQPHVEDWMVLLHTPKGFPRDHIGKVRTRIPEFLRDGQGGRHYFKHCSGEGSPSGIQRLACRWWTIQADIVTDSDTQALFSVSLDFSSIPSTMRSCQESLRSLEEPLRSSSGCSCPHGSILLNVYVSISPFLGLSPQSCVFSFPKCKHISRGGLANWLKNKESI